MIRDGKEGIFIVTRDTGFQLPPGCILCHDYMELVERFKESEDKLLVSGGGIVLKLFIPYASSLDLAEYDDLHPGDLIFDEWDDCSFEVVQSKEWDGGRTMHCRRSSVSK